MKNTIELDSVYQHIILNALQNTLTGMEDVLAERILKQSMLMRETEACYELSTTTGNKQK